jgi:hypothetical protein
LTVIGIILIIFLRHQNPSSNQHRSSPGESAMCHAASTCQPIDAFTAAATLNQASPSAVQLGTTPAATGRATSTVRLKLWQLPHKYHCPIIGACIDVGALRALSRRAGALPGNGLSDYEVHVGFVSAADDKNPLSAALQKALDRCHAAAIKRTAALRTTGALHAHWQKALADGQVPGALWALMTHPLSDEDLRRQVYEDVHMRSHQVGAGIGADLRELAAARRRISALEHAQATETKRQARALAERDAHIAELNKRLARLDAAEHAAREANARLAALESGAAVQTLQSRLNQSTAECKAAQREQAALRARCDRLEQRLADARTTAADLEQRLAERQASCDALARILSLDSDDADAPCCNDGDCANCAHAAAGLDLGGRRILCVGGRGSLATHYRDLVRRCNGELIRHDGGMEESRQRLDALLASADAVVCPADHVSHDAYRRAKRFCKRMAKPCVLLDRSGVDTFARALAELAVMPGFNAANDESAHRAISA